MRKITRERVSRVIDGDTFRTAGRKEPIRLQGVYAPERGRPGSGAATASLVRLISGKTVYVKSRMRDRYRRLVAQVEINGRSVNSAMKISTAKQRDLRRKYAIRREYAMRSRRSRRK